VANRARPAVPAGASANLTALAMAGPSLGWASGFTMANANASFEPLLSGSANRRTSLALPGS
jgi:hypothetical protein